MARALIAALVIGWAPSLRAEGRPAYGGTVHAALASATVSVDPLSGAPGDAEAAALVFDTPLRCDGARPRPHLALALDNPAKPEDPLRARLRLRTDVRFHDGTVLRAADVAESLGRALGDPAGWTLAPVRAARAVAEDVVELELTRPAPDLALLLCTPAAAVTRAGARRLVGTGPFFVDKQDAQGVRLMAHAAHFAGRPYLDAVILRAFTSLADESGSFQVGALQAARHASGAAAGPLGSGARRPTIPVDGPAALTVYLALGRDLSAALVGPLGRALALGIDRDRLRRLVPGPSLSTAGAGHDAVQARTALEPALAGHRLAVRLLVDGTRLDDRALADRLLADLARLGVDLTVETADAASFERRRAAGRYALLLGAAAPPAADAALVELALMAAVDPGGARALLARSPARLGMTSGASAPVIPLFQRGARVLHAPSLSGLVVDGAGRVGWADVHQLRAR